MIDYDKKLLEKLKKAREVAIDTETKSLEDRTMVGFSIAYANESEYIPVLDKFLINMERHKAIKLLNFILTNCHVIFHNSSFDIPVLAYFGADVKNLKGFDDTVIMANLVDENMPHGLKKLTKKYFNYQMKEYKDICGTGKKQLSFDEVASNEKQLYARDDAEYTLRLYHKLMSQLDLASLKIYEEIEKPLLPTVAWMHIKGIRINIKQVQQISKKCINKIESTETKLKILMGDINFNSPKQLKEYFIAKCNMPVIKQSAKTNAPSVDKEVLEKYAESGNNEAQLLLEYRKYSKIYSTFISALTPGQWDATTMTGYIHASFNQAGTVSGRFSSSNPNMQNIPHEDPSDEDYLGLREAIIADPGHVLIGADYSQIELRVLAECSQDYHLMKAYREGKDIHQQTADACGIDRYNAKTINFGLVYGMGYKTLAKRIKVRPYDAKQFIERYFEAYPGVKEFWDREEKNFRQNGYVQTLFGRKRRQTNWFYKKDDFDQGGEIRSALNAIIQGSAADLIKKAMVSMAPQLEQIGARIISQVHDEVLVSAPIDKAERAYAIVHRAMVEAGQSLSVPIEVDCHFGHNWQEAHTAGISLKEIKNEKTM